MLSGFCTDYLNCFWPHLFQIFFAHWAEKFSSVTTVGEPVLLLPTVKTRGSESDLLYYLGWNFFPSAIPTDSLRVGELDPKFLVRCAICNAPRADVFEFVRAVRYTVVGEPSRFPANWTHLADGTMLPVAVGLG